MTEKSLKNRWFDNKNLLRVLKKSEGFNDNKSDFRGIPLGSTNKRTDIKKIKICNGNFSYADFENCNFIKVIFKDCTFYSANLKQARFWNSEFINCTFSKIDFQNATLGIDSIYDSCWFQSCKLEGKSFDFGDQSKFLNCRFLKCQIRSTWVLSILFDNCTFESKFFNVRFSGSKEAKIEGKKAFPATLKKCILENSYFENVEIMDGVIIQNSTFPEQESIRFNNDRTYFE